MYIRITFDNFGTLNHMFFTSPESEAVQSWRDIFGNGSVKIISVGQATSTKDFGGFIQS